MDFNEIKVNNRLQIESENINPQLRCVRGIVLDVNANSVVLVSDFGELVEIDKNSILSITKINFDKIVSDALVTLKNYHAEIYERECQIKKLKEKQYALVEELYDANFLSKFNVVGAKNRLDKSIDQGLLAFQRGIYDYGIHFECNPNSQIELIIRVENTIEYYNSDQIDRQKIIRLHAPDEKEVIARSFNFAKIIEELEKNMVYKQENFYIVYTIYKMMVDVDQNNFIEKRREIIHGLKKLRR